MKELEMKNAVERKRLIQTIYNFLRRSNVTASLAQEQVLNSLGTPLNESIIRLNEQNINTIRLLWIDSANCNIPGNLLRFQYQIHLGEMLKQESLSRFNAMTKIIKLEKVLGVFGGRVKEVKWIGKEIAEVLNRDAEIKEILLSCVKIMGEIQFEIEAVSPSDILITGPLFSNPVSIINLYAQGKKIEEENCVFSYKTVDRIAKLIRNSAVDSEFLNKNT